MLLGQLALTAAAMIVCVTTIAAAHGKIPINRFIGIRIRPLTASTAAWQAGHRAAIPLLTGGTIITLAGIPACILWSAPDDITVPLASSIIYLITTGLAALRARVAGLTARAEGPR